MEAFTLILAMSLALVHVCATRLRFLDVVPRSRWLSLCGGVSVAYIFVHLMPELAVGQRSVETLAGGPAAAIGSHVWLMALAGLVVFYGIERAVKRSSTNAAGEGPALAGVFWLHIGSFALYNVIIGYLLLHRVERGTSNTLLFWFAMLLHFLANDFALRKHHPQRYAHSGRWLLAAAVMAGWLLGVGLELGEATIALLIAFVGGGVVLNVLKEELPEERESSFAFFVSGAVAYAGVLVAL